MNIDDIRPDSVHGTGIRPVRDTGHSEAGVAPVGGPAAAHRTDRIEISAEGRALVGTRDPDGIGDIEELDPDGVGEVEDLDPTRFGEIQDRIAHGGYDAPGIVDELARRLLDSGDL